MHFLLYVPDDVSHPDWERELVLWGRLGVETRDLEQCIESARTGSVTADDELLLDVSAELGLGTRSLA